MKPKVKKEIIEKGKLKMCNFESFNRKLHGSITVEMKNFCYFNFSFFSAVKTPLWTAGKTISLAFVLFCFLLTFRKNYNQVQRKNGKKPETETI